MKQISIVIPTTGNMLYLTQLLNSIEIYLSDYTLEINIVCNPVCIQVSVLAETYKKINVKVIQNRIPGVNRARQVGLNLATKDFVLFLDDDCRFTNVQQIDVLYNELSNDCLLFAVGGSYQPSSTELNRFAKAYAENQMIWLRQGCVDSKKKENAYLIGGYFLMRRSFCLDYQLEFDQSMEFGGTEKEFFLNAYVKKMKMKLLDISIEHFYPNQFFTYIVKVYKQGRGLRYIHEKGLNFAPKYLDFSIKSPWLIFFDWVFWSGYFLSRNEYFKFISYFLRLFLNFINEKKIILLNRFKKNL